jgi:hypothetical protein
MRFKMIEVSSARAVYPLAYRPFPVAGRVWPAPHWTYRQQEAPSAVSSLYRSCGHVYGAAAGLYAAGFDTGHYLFEEAEL